MYILERENMININNKSWDKLKATDISKFLFDLEENIFFEFKSDDVDTKKFSKEVSAFSNTYGGYIFIGVNDDKTITGCSNWTENRIHTTIRDSITPVPNFDVKKFNLCEKTVLVVRIEEGTVPPYITNQGEIFIRVSSGTCKVKNSYELLELYNKHKDQLHRIKNKIEIEPIAVSQNSPSNICAYLDVGFSMVSSQQIEMQKRFYKTDLKKISDFIKTTCKDYSISHMGTSYVISIGRVAINDNDKLLVQAGLHNFIEIMHDGSVKYRIIFSAEPGDNKSDISHVGYWMYKFSQIYSMIFGKKVAKGFIHAHKYEKITVVNQFIPFYKLTPQSSQEDINSFGNYLIDHQKNYGNNIVINSIRFPKNDYLLIDKRYFDDYKIKYNNEKLVQHLFVTRYSNLGYIDEPDNS